MPAEFARLNPAASGPCWRTRLLLPALLLCVLAGCAEPLPKLAPPQSVWDCSDEDVHRMLLQGLEDILGKPMPPEQVPAFLAQVIIHRAERLVAGDVATAIVAAGSDLASGRTSRRAPPCGR